MLSKEALVQRSRGIALGRTFSGVDFHKSKQETRFWHYDNTTSLKRDDQSPRICNRPLTTVLESYVSNHSDSTKLTTRYFGGGSVPLGYGVMAAGQAVLFALCLWYRHHDGIRFEENL